MAALLCQTIDMNPIRTLIAACILLGVAPVASAEKPNVLFIAMDDLNDWIGCLGGHPQTITPNLDRLAASGMLFRNAYCPAPSCNPSRSAVFSGRPPHRTGLYQNTQKLRDVMPDEVLLPRHFSNHGYWSAGSGKMLHYMIDPQSWDDYFPEKSKDNPFPRSYDPPNRPVSLPVAGPWQYRETDWAALNVTNEQFGGDWLVTKWIGEQLQQPREKPFFLACGIYRPHEPWFVPKQYFEPFPLESIQLPPGYKENDLEDVPAEGQRIARNRYFPHILKHKQWKQGIQAYLASIHFADAMLGRVLDALESSPHRDNTIVVLWSDHGWHLGEKEHWQKFTPWRAAARVPLMIRVPQGTPGLPEGTKPGGLCDRPVNLVDLFTHSPRCAVCRRNRAPKTTASSHCCVIPARSGRMPPSPISTTQRTLPSAPNAGDTSATATAARNSTTSKPTPTSGRTSRRIPNMPQPSPKCARMFLSKSPRSTKTNPESNPSDRNRISPLPKVLKHRHPTLPKPRSPTPPSHPTS